MGRLHNEEAGAGDYNFEAVSNDDNSFDEGLTALDELYILINDDNAHWTFIQVTIYATTIQVFNSQGKKDENNRFLKAANNYMYNALSKNAECERQDFGM